METEAKRGPGRPRKEAEGIPAEVAARRKRILEERRGGSVGHQRMKLGVNLAALDREHWEYRWVNGDPMRMASLTQNDVWEPVTGAGYRPDVDGTVTTLTGKDEDGKPITGYLMRKPKVYFDEDKAGKREQIEQKMKRIQRAEGETAVQNSYAPEGGIRVNRG